MKTFRNFGFAVFLILLLNCSGIDDEKQAAGSGNDATGQAMVFHRVSEPNEQAFTFLLPDSWKISGGISRVDPNTGGGAGNAIEAKLYMKATSADNRSEMGWLPDTRFFDMRRYPGANLAAPMFPDGSNYNGMLVMPLPSPDIFIQKVAVPFVHPHARGLKISGVQPMPELAEQYANASARMLPGYEFAYQTAILTLEYAENGVQYLEKMVCVIEDYGPMGAGLWGNKETWYVRSQKSEFNKMAPVFATIGQSVRLNPKWISREVQSQQTNSNIALETQKAVAQIDREITEHRVRTNAEINNDMYLNLTGQEDYTNPFTGETERGTNEWDYRWENERGDVIYHNNRNYNPNEDASLSIQGFKRSTIKKR